MSEMNKSVETLGRLRHGVRRFTGKSILTWEQKKQFDSEIDPLGGVLHPNWEARETQATLEESRPPASRAVRSLSRWLVEWWRADEPNFTTGDTTLAFTEEDWLDIQVNGMPEFTERQKHDIEVTVNAVQGVKPDNSGFYDGVLDRVPLKQS